MTKVQSLTDIPSVHPASERASMMSFLLVLTAYMFLVRAVRFRRATGMQAAFGSGKRLLSSMTRKEAFDIMTQLQELEFPSAMAKARTLALLKAGGIPTMSRLFAVTGQNNLKNSAKRAVDTEILLREVQSQPRNSDRYMQAVARMNYLHTRYRKAGKILDDDLLHTLGDNIVEIFRIVDGSEWRKLSDVEKCAVGIFHMQLGEDMDIPFTSLPSSEVGWQDGLHFALELRDWTVQYAERVAKPNKPSDQYVRVYVDGATSKLPRAVTRLIRKLLGAELDDAMRSSLNVENPGPILQSLIITLREARRLILRYLCLPRPTFLAVKSLQESPDPSTGLFNFSQVTLQPWYVQPSLWNKWGPNGLFFRIFGGRAAGSKGDRYHPQGYDLNTIGPQPQHGKGTEEMAAIVEFMKSRAITECPFPHKR